MYLALSIPLFPAQTLAALQPRLRGTPFAVIRQSLDNHKTPVWACSHEAEGFGIGGGMPLTDAKRLCRNLTVVKRDEAAEQHAYTALKRLLESYTPEYVLHISGKGFLNLTGTPVLRTYSAPDAARRFRAEAMEKTGMSRVALGLSVSPLLAKMLARAGTDGLRHCPLRQERSMLEEMDAGLLPRLSGQCRSDLDRYGLKTVRHVRKLSKQFLIGRFGREGERLYLLSRGIDCPDASAGRSLKETAVLPYDINDRDVLLRKLRLTVDRLCFRLKRNGLEIDRFALTIRYTDDKTVQRSFRLPAATNDFLTLAEGAEQMLWKLYTRRAALKSIRIKASRPRQETLQTDLFDTLWDRKQKDIGSCITRIRGKNKFTSILSGSNAPDLNRNGFL
ncbi:hypothetical protein ACFL5V_07840 [Fibrobacterota bacterium]